MVGNTTINRLTHARMAAAGGPVYFPVSFYLTIVVGFFHALLFLFSTINFGINEFDDFWELSGSWPVSVAWSFVILYGLFVGVIVFELAGRFVAQRRFSLVHAIVYILCGSIVGVGLLVSQFTLNFPATAMLLDGEGSSVGYSEPGPNSLYVQYIPLHASTDRSISGYNISEHAICNQALQILPQEQDEWARKIEPTYHVHENPSFKPRKVRMRITTPEGISYITDVDGNAIIVGPDDVVRIVEGWRGGVYGTYTDSLPSPIIAEAIWDSRALKRFTHVLERRLAEQGCAIPKSCYRPSWIKGAVTMDECRPLPEYAQDLGGS